MPILATYSTGVALTLHSVEQLATDLDRADSAGLRRRQRYHPAPVFRDFPLYDTTDSPSTLALCAAR